AHTTAILTAFPEFASVKRNYTPERYFGVFDPVLDPTNEKVYDFLDKLFGEMAGLFPDKYFHIGGDENTGKDWQNTPHIRAFMKSNGMNTYMDLQTYFNKRLLPIIISKNKIMMGWDEILHPDLPKDAMIQSWRNTDALIEAAKQGYDSILSAPYYIDLLHPASFHYKDVIANEAAIPAEQRKHILGGEATMWSEWVSPETIDSRIWPRTAAIAEKFWSPAGTTDVDDMYRRLTRVDLQLEELGLTHKKHVGMLLRRLSGSQETALLGQFLTVVEPVKGYRRGRLQPGLGALMPLTRLVDAANADPAAGRRAEKLVDSILNDAPAFSAGSTELLESFAEWQKLSASLQPVLEANPGLQEAAPLSLELSRTAGIGMEALRLLRSGQTPTPDWIAGSKAALDHAAQTKFPLELSILRPVRELATAAAELGQLQTLGKDKWRAHVKQIAFPPPRPRQ
ncbi:MAG: family 20 glycosylhydrolase, partial [Terriglobales bacterium]